jgi:hypothetical protein
MHSTLTALIEATDNWSINIDKGLLNGVIFIDHKKAFDTIDHTILLRKLRIYGVDENGIKFFESYLSNRSQKWCVKGDMARNGGHQAVGRAGSCFLDNSVHYVDQWFSFGKYKMAVYFY